MFPIPVLEGATCNKVLVESIRFRFVFRSTGSRFTHGDGERKVRVSNPTSSVSSHGASACQTLSPPLNVIVNF